jgi:hypothetical protein
MRSSFVGARRAIGAVLLISVIVAPAAFAAKDRDESPFRRFIRRLIVHVLDDRIGVPLP